MGFFYKYTQGLMRYLDPTFNGCLSTAVNFGYVMVCF